MSHLSEMLGKTTDTIKEVLIPVGTWRAQIKKAKLTEPKEDKNGNEFVQALFMLKPIEPGHDVDATEVSEVQDDLRTATLFYRFGPIYGVNEITKLTKILSAIGVTTKGADLAQCLDEAKGLEVEADVRHEMYEGETRTTVSKIFAVEAEEVAPKRGNVRAVA